MAVMNPKKGQADKPTGQPAVDVRDVTLVPTGPDGYKGVTVDTKSVGGLSSLMTFLEGQSWIVDYYSQVLGADDATNSLQDNIHEVYQQYRLIRGFELKVTTPLTYGQDAETKESSATGAANVYGIFVPNEGDVFIADVGDGREGVFQITSTVKKTMYRESAYEIEYRLTKYNSKHTAQDLKDKVVETRYFSRDYLRDGYNPLLRSEDLDNRDKLEKHYARLLAMYFHDFYSYEVGTLLVPNQKGYVYDPFVVQFLLNILSTDENPLLRQVRQLNVSQDQNMYEFTLWNCLETMDYQMLPMTAQEMVIVPKRVFFSRPAMNSIYYSKVDAVIYPQQHGTTLDAGMRPYTPVVGQPLEVGRARFEEFRRLLRQPDLTPEGVGGPYREAEGRNAPQIHPVTADNFYVFTEAFYNFNGEYGGLSLLENLTLDALRGQALDLKVLEQVCFGSKYWDNVERFYYIPVLLVLLRVYPRGL